MTLALPFAPNAARASRLAFARVSGWDVLAVGALVALWAGTLAMGCASLPMQLWDESRNANNALEMALHGHWLTPTYGGAVDHWNTKPPLMIWAMAGLLKLGLPPLVALRAPAMLAALATVLAIFGVLRVALKDRLAAFAGGVLLLGAVIYIGPHAARTADYDAPESAFILGYVLSTWAAFESGRTRWLFLAAGLLALGVLTKGVAAALPLPGLGLYALTRPARLRAFVLDARTWAAAAVALLAIGGYYLSREAYDPGYLSAIAGNELGGRFLKVTEHHHGSWHFYLRVLLEEAEPLAPIALAAPIPLRRAAPARRHLALVCGLAAMSLLVVLSTAKSKMEWYATPMAPLLAVVAGLAISETVRRVSHGAAGAAARRRAAATRAGAGLLLAGTAAFGLWWGSSLAARTAAEPGRVQFNYGPLLAAARSKGVAGPLTVLDTGFYNDAGFAAYDPMLKFYADLSAARGLAVSVVHTDDGELEAGALVATCDPRAMRRLDDDYRLTRVLDVQGCRLDRVAGEALETAGSGDPASQNRPLLPANAGMSGP